MPLRRLKLIPFTHPIRVKGRFKYGHLSRVTLALHTLLMATASELNFGHFSVSAESLGASGEPNGLLRQIAEPALVAKGVTRPHRRPAVSSVDPVAKSTTTASPATATITTTTTAPLTTHASPTTAQPEKDSALRTTTPAYVTPIAQPEFGTTSGSAAQQQLVLNGPSLPTPTIVDNSGMHTVISPFPVDGQRAIWPGAGTLSGQAVPHWGTTATPPTYSASTQRGSPSRATLYTTQQGLFTIPVSALPKPMSVPVLLPLAALHGRPRPATSLPRGVWPASSSPFRLPQTTAFDIGKLDQAGAE